MSKSDYQREYRLKNKEKLQLYKKKYHESHKVKKAEYDKKYRETHKKEIKLYRENNREHRNEVTKIWKSKNKDKVKQYKTQDYLKNKDKYNKIRREKYTEDPEKILSLNKIKLQNIGISLNMNSLEYHNALESWSKLIKERDNNTCINCGKHDDLQSHHILYKSKYPKLSLNLNNGITLCKRCHGEAHGYKTIILVK